jgi:hypothetical protein
MSFIIAVGYAESEGRFEGVLMNGFDEQTAMRLERLAICAPVGPWRSILHLQNLPASWVYFEDVE